MKKTEKQKKREAFYQKSKKIEEKLLKHVNWLIIMPAVIFVALHYFFNVSYWVLFGLYFFPMLFIAWEKDKLE